MRVLSVATFFFVLTITLTGCTKGNQVNGRSLRSANKSVNYIKDRLPVEQRIEFEVSFWSLRDEYRNKDEFLDTVGGKTPEELIIMGKDLFQKRKNSGYKEYRQYNNWDQMIAHFTQERIDQNKRKNPVDKRRNSSVMYKL